MPAQESDNRAHNIDPPVALAALSLCILAFTQLIGFRTGTEAEIAAMKWQSSMADEQIASLRESSAKLAKTIEERKPDVAQSKATQKQFSEIIRELNALAREGDKDAKTIMGPDGLADQSAVTQKLFTDAMKDMDGLARGGDKDAASIMGLFLQWAPAPSSVPPSR